jgi:LDH2 family malate/lactate/ureidoglycolate dehydrogenase
VKNIYDDKETGQANVGHFFILLDITKFMDLSIFLESIESLLDEMREVPKVPGMNEIRYPGERRKREREQRLSEGIQLSSSVEEELIQLGSQFNIRFPAPISLEKIQ